MNRIGSIAPRAAFQPPSDMGGGGGGSSTGKKVFIGLGIGCGVVLVILGILFAAGAFKAVSCCSDIQQFAGDATAAVAFADEFANDLHDGNLEQAYEKTTSTYQGNVDLAAFKAAVEQHRDRLTAAPRQGNVNLEHHGDEPPSMETIKGATWLVDYHFSHPGDQMFLWANFRIEPQEEGGFAVDGVLFDVRPRVLESEPPAQEVQRVVEELRGGRYEAVHFRLDEAMRDTVNAEQWRAFLGAEGAVLTTGRMEVREITYSDAGDQATVMTHHRASDDTQAIVQWELRPGLGIGQWRVAAIAPLVAAPQSPSEAPSEAPSELPTDEPDPSEGEPTADGAPAEVISIDVE